MQIDSVNLNLVDVHAPAKTYYTTGNNAGNAINRIRTFSVNISFILIKADSNTYIFPQKKKGTSISVKIE